MDDNSSFPEIEKNKAKFLEELSTLNKPFLKLEEARLIYNQVFLALKKINDDFACGKALNVEEVLPLAEKLASQILLPDEKIVFLASELYFENHLLFHTVNTAILSIRIGRHLNYIPELVTVIGVLAILHSYYDAQENGLQALGEQDFIRNFLKDKRLEEGWVQEALSIIAVVDVYESLTHGRKYRDRFMPYEVLKAIIHAEDSLFDPEIVREVLMVFSLYPLGSFVRLNNDEIAQVIRINYDFPLRPQIVVLMDASGNKLNVQNAIDLSTHLNIHIKEPIF